MQIKQSPRRGTLVFPIALLALLISAPAGAQTDYVLNPVPPYYIEANTVLLDRTNPLEPVVFRGDDAWLQIELPFPFTFYRALYDSGQPIYISTNGYINFLAGNSVYSNDCLPSGASPNGAIYAFWDDLVVDDLASVRTELLGTAPNRQFVIEWRNVTFFSDGVRRFDFEIVLSETGAILLQYRNIEGDIDSGDTQEMGNSATIGLENQPGIEAVQFSCPNDSAMSVDSNISTFIPIGPGEFALGFSQSTGPVVVPVDIKPGGCPNPLNVGGKGVLPVAILGTSGFDVTMIDPTTVTLGVPNSLGSTEGVAPLRWSLEDVGTPYERLLSEADPYDCNSFGPDGYLDTAFTFDSEAIAKALGPVNDGDTLFLEVRGQLKDGNGTGNGTPISGQDVVRVLKKGK